MEYGLQMYSVRDFTEKDLLGKIKKVAEIGYKYIEFAGFFGNSAEDVKAALDANGIACNEEEREYLFYQDQEAFLDDIEDTPDGSVIVAVGHIPFMEDVLERLTGECISFTPGSVAAVTLPGSPRAQIPEGDVLWFVRGPKVAKPRG